MEFKDLMEKIKAGEIDQSKIRVVLDNDHVDFWLGTGKSDADGDEIEDRIRVEEGGYCPAVLLEAALALLGFPNVHDA